nr:ligase-associated DNA damage response endonuclease PdeM [Synechococcus sp. RSCCF101]
MPPGIEGLRWDWQGHDLMLLGDRALWDPAQRLLLVADLHLGKAETFQAHGIPLPSDGDRTTLNALIALSHALQPSELIVLGDLFHSRLGLTPELRQTLAALPELLGCPLCWIEGNHDRRIHLEGLRSQPSHGRGPLWLSHEPQPPQQRPPQAAAGLGVCGHLHPVVRLGDRTDRLRLPCFAFAEELATLILPSFGALTGGHPARDRWRTWVVADGSVLPWRPRTPSGRR